MFGDLKTSAARRIFLSSLAALGLCIGAAATKSSAAVTVDGTLDPAYGPALSTQVANTQFGTNTAANASPSTAGGSELDAGYGVVQSGTLYLFFSGNLENNFNKLDIFIQAGAGGQNQLTTQSTGGQGTFDRLAGDGTAADGPGLKFDAGFAPTAMFSLTAGGGAMYVNNANLVTNTSGYAGNNNSTAGGPYMGPLTGGTTIPSLQAALNDSNVSNTDGSPKPGATTGAELAISLADLGYTGGNITVQAFVNGSNSDFVSNQSLGSLPAGSANLGDPRFVDFSSIAGSQTFTVVVPEPASVGLLGLVSLIGLGRKVR